jgi:hypothetical protein
MPYASASGKQLTPRQLTVEHNEAVQDVLVLTLVMILETHAETDTNCRSGIDFVSYYAHQLEKALYGPLSKWEDIYDKMIGKNSPFVKVAV